MEEVSSVYRLLCTSFNGVGTEDVSLLEMCPLLGAFSITSKDPLDLYTRPSLFFNLCDYSDQYVS